jgi:hypothetical protein
MKTQIRFTLILITCFISGYLFTGCNHTDYLSFTPEYNDIEIPNKISPVTPKIVFSKGKFEDIRQDTTRVGYFEVDNGQHKYTMLSERPLGDMFYEGFKKLIEISGHTFGDNANSDIMINITLKELNMEYVAPFIGVKHVETGVKINVEFIESKSGKSLYKTTYKSTGSKDIFTILSGIAGPASDSFDDAFINLFKTIGNDQLLVNELNLYNIKKN